MQKRPSLGRALASGFVLLLPALLGGPRANAAGEFCLIPPIPHSPAASPFGYDLWNSLNVRPQGGVRAFSIPMSGYAARAAQTPGPVRPSSIGTLNALVLLVDFDDTPAFRPNLNVRDTFFGTPRDAPYGSVAQYYGENSYGLLKFDGAILGDPRADAADNPDPTLQVKWMRMPHNYAWYANNAFGLSPVGPQNAMQLVVDALTSAQSLYPNFDWSQFDQNHDGYVDLLVVVHAGEGAEGTLDPTQIWSHRDQIPDFTLSTSSPSGAPLKVRDFAMVSESNDTGVFAHEIGHVLGLPDLYTYPSGQANGLGQWSIMASGSYTYGNVPPQYFTTRPSDFDAWCKIQLGWINPTLVTKSMAGVQLPPIETNPVALKIPADPNNPLEYYLIANRQAIPGTYDAPVSAPVIDPKTNLPVSVSFGGLPGQGVLIYHVDEKRGSNDDRGHLLVELEEADSADLDKLGRPMGFNLLLPEQDPNANFGDAGDPFGGKHHTFSNTSEPPSVNYSGNDSGVRVVNIQSPANANATFDIVLAGIQANVLTANGANRPVFAVQLLTPLGQVVPTPGLQISGSQFTISDLNPGDYLIQITANGFIPQSIPVHKGQGPAILRLFLSPQPAASSVSVGWNLLTIPYTFNGAKVSDVLGQPKIIDYGWDGTQYVSNPPVVPGQGYWIYLTDPSQFKIAAAGISTSPESPISVPIKKGWNLIGNPYPRSITWDVSRLQIQAADGTTTTLDQAGLTGVAAASGWVYHADTKEYSLLRRGDPLLLNQGFWYYTNVPGNFVFPAPSAATTSG